MKYEELLAKYQALLLENANFKRQIELLKAASIPADSTRQEADGGFASYISSDSAILFPEEKPIFLSESTVLNRQPTITNLSEPTEKIKLFMALFRGRDDVYAKRWENSKKGTSGYSPVCLNEWKIGLCRKPVGKCNDCDHKSYATLDERVIDEHLRGRGNFVAGIYPLCQDETCYFLAIDFDDGEWQKDISTLRETCGDFDIPMAMERSRSGQGGHAWFFFENSISANLARKFGTALLTFSMSKRHEINFKSYDRLFPNQDTMPKGGFGNLIALPLQKAARINHNSEFVNEVFEAYLDQWAFLASIRKIAEDDVEKLTLKLSHGNECGILIKGDEEIQKPWETSKTRLLKTDFPQEVEIVRANMLFINRAGISQRALNRLKRLAAFKNPEFSQAQALRLSTSRIPRIISCSEEVSEFLCLPRGCETALEAVLSEAGARTRINDKTKSDINIDVEFCGQLREEQSKAIEQLLQNDIGVLSGTTAFGKTIVAIKLIAERKVNTLILVDKVNLVSQWRTRLLEFLAIHETLPDIDAGILKKRGRKTNRSIIGQIGGGKNNLNGIVDIAVMQSLYHVGEVNECIKNYGMIIVDECHHVSAFSFESILKSAIAKYVYGLTATPVRKDGHHPIIFMQCGPIRYRDNAKKQAENRPFEHYVIPRFTSMHTPLGREDKVASIQELYAEVVRNVVRNELIVADVIESHANGRNCVVLTERTAHVELLAKALSANIPNVIALVGGMGAKDYRDKMQQIANVPIGSALTLVATGKYLGEGFDEPRLDTLFLAMPISWKGTLQQYAGRLHRLFENKKEVQIFDYVDIHVKMLERMYHKRIAGYASIGYKTKGEEVAPDSINIIYDKNNFLPVFINDVMSSARQVVVVSPFVSKQRALFMMKQLEFVLQKNGKVIIVTRPIDDFKEKDRAALQEVFDLLKTAGADLIARSHIHLKFAVVDQRIVWYGSINLLSFGSAEENIMRLESHSIAEELLKSITKQ